MKLKNILNENWVVIDPRGNASPVGSKIQGDRYVKGKKGYYVILAKHAMTARRAIEKAGGRATSAKIRDLMWDLRYEEKNKDDILAEIDGSKFNNEDFKNIQLLPQILNENFPLEKDINESFELGNIKLTVNKIKKYEKELIKWEEK